jgi:type II secretory ATPase GspE/PulE/Tfp pilus assembly ATPase PilB-like protein
MFTWIDENEDIKAPVLKGKPCSTIDKKQKKSNSTKSNKFLLAPVLSAFDSQEEAVIEGVESNLNYPTASELAQLSTMEARYTVSYEECIKLGVLPLQIFCISDSEKQVSFATSHDFTQENARDLRFLVDASIHIKIYPKELLLEALHIAYRFNEAQLNKYVALASYEDSKNNLIQSLATSSISVETSLTKFLDTLIEYAAHRRASDIHFNLYQHEVLILFRINGNLTQTITSINCDLYGQLVRRCLVLIKKAQNNNEQNSDGEFSHQVNEKNICCRVSIVETARGQRLVIRLQNPFLAISYDLKNLGFQLTTYDLIVEGLSRPFGLHLIGGATGNGKSTTLYSIANYFKSKNKSVISIENPVEVDLAGITQMQGQSEHFSRLLKSILRQDPDVIILGEIRDEETMSGAINAALTGHIVCATIHAYNFQSLIMRASSLAVDRAALFYVLGCAVVQRLIKVICPKCKMSTNNPKKECIQCSASGFIERKIITDSVLTPYKKEEITITDFLSYSDKAILKYVSFKESFENLKDTDCFDLSDIHDI